MGSSRALRAEPTARQVRHTHLSGGQGRQTERSLAPRDGRRRSCTRRGRRRGPSGYSGPPGPPSTRPSPALTGAHASPLPMSLCLCFSAFPTRRLPRSPDPHPHAHARHAATFRPRPKSNGSLGGPLNSPSGHRAAPKSGRGRAAGLLPRPDAPGAPRGAPHTAHPRAAAPERRHHPAVRSVRTGSCGCRGIAACSSCL
jgi:hypothetical protein